MKINKKHIRITIFSAIVIIISFFLYNSYEILEEQNSRYRDSYQNDINKESIKKEPQIDKSRVFKFVSNSNDLENQSKILQRNDEITYHKFDFKKNEITLKTPTTSGKWKTIQFKIDKAKIKESLLGLKGMEFDIDHKHCYQVWVSTVGNIGYEFDSGQKLVFYGVKEITD